MIPDYVIGLWIGGGLGFVIGLVLLAVARAADRKNYIVQRATPMPLSLVNERDDVWLRGRAECDSPLSAPHFDTACLYFSYKLEERVTRTRSTKNGTRTSTSWETRERLSGAADFRLRDGDNTIDIDGTGADFRDLEKLSERRGKWRHSVSYMPYPTELSAIGSVSERRERLESYANIPLIVTHKTRAEFVKAAERSETLMRFFGFLLVWAGAGAGLYGLFDYASWPVATSWNFAWETLGAGVGAGTGVFVPIWAIYIYNTFLAYSVRVENSWRQIDVDIKMRYDLVPNLVAAVKGYLEHEKSILERLTSVRSEAVSGGRAGRIAAEGRAAEAVAELAVVVERYPDLKSQPVVARLMREITALEEKIAHGRSTYNEAVREYNENVMCFPRALIARAAGFKAHTFFAVDTAERHAPSVASAG
jgi:LemA protein